MAFGHTNPKSPAITLSEFSIASAGTIDLGQIPSSLVSITGTTTITSFGSSASTLTPLYNVRFTGALTLTHNATSLILPTSANITTAAGDTALFQYLDGGNWKCIFYQPLNGLPLTTVTVGKGGLGITTTPTNGQIPIGNGTNYVAAAITNGGGLTATGGSGTITLGVSALQTLWIPAAAMRPSQTGGCAALALVASAANQPDISSLDFDTTTQEFAQFYVRFPKGWNASTITFAPVWSHPSTSTNFGVVWALQAVSIADNEAMGVAYGTEQTSTDTGGTTDKQYVGPASAAITIAGTPAAGEVVYFRVKRNPADASDTMAVDARLQGVVIFYTITTLDDT